MLDKWVYFIKHAEDLDFVPAHAKQTYSLAAAYEVADRFNWQPRELEAIEYWEMRERTNQDAAFEKGKNEGQQQKALETALKMLAKGYELVEIAELTGFSPDDLAALLSEH